VHIIILGVPSSINISRFRKYFAEEQCRQRCIWYIINISCVLCAVVRSCSVQVPVALIHSPVARSWSIFIITHLQVFTTIKLRGALPGGGGEKKTPRKNVFKFDQNAVLFRCFTSSLRVTLHLTWLWFSFSYMARRILCLQHIASVHI